MPPKGISPVIASIILVLIVITLTSSYLIFTGRLASTQQQAGEQQASELTQRATTLFHIEDVRGQTVTLVNDGLQTIPVNAFTVTVREHALNYTLTSPIEPRQRGEMLVRGLWLPGRGDHRLTVRAGATADSVPITIDIEKEGRVLDLRFEEGEGTTTRDSSPYGFVGTLVGGVNWTEGKVGGGIKLDGVNDQVTFADDAKHRLDRVTLAAWVRPDNNSKGTVVGKFALPPDGTYNYYLRTRDDLMTRDPSDACLMHVHNSTEAPHNAVCPAGTMSANHWYHVVGTADGSNLRIYTDGGLRAETTNVPIATLDKDAYEGIRIGTMAGTANWFSGVIDEVLVYDRAYTPDQLYVMKRR